MNAEAHRNAIANARKKGIRGKAPRPMKPQDAGRQCHCGGWQRTGTSLKVGIIGKRPFEVNPCSRKGCKERFTNWLPLTKETAARVMVAVEAVRGWWRSGRLPHYPHFP